MRLFLWLLIGGACFSRRLAAADPPAHPGRDRLLFVDGELLIGTLERSTGKQVVFKSDLAGEVTVEWNKIKELRTGDTFAVIPKRVKLERNADPSVIPQGSLTVENQQIQVANPRTAVRRSIPVSESASVVNQTTFEKAVLQRPGFFENWKGTIAAGASLVQATQKSRTFTSGVSLVRAVPLETWLDPASRTTVNFAASYGKVSDPGKRLAKTEIYHGDAERDRYFSPRTYVFAQLAYDHNFSQGLDLQQQYGIGVGVTLIKEESEQLDLKNSVNYLRQSFQTAARNQNLIGSTFANQYRRSFANNLVLTEQLAVTPSWNNLDAYSANGGLTLALPLYKRFNVNLGVLDTFLNDPPPGFRKNSLQFVTGLSYALP